MRGSWRPNRTATYWPSTLLTITAFLSRSPGLLNRGPSLSECWFSLPHLISNWSDPQLVWSSHCNCSIGGLRAHSAGCWLSLPHLVSSWSDLQTDWISCALSYIIVPRPPSCGRYKSHSFNPSTVKVIFWYSLSECTCYLHRCISYFDSPAGSYVYIQHK